MEKCNISDMSSALRGAADAKSGNIQQNTKGMSLTEQDHYNQGYNRLSYKTDLLVQQGKNNPLYWPMEFFAPSDLYGRDVTSKIDDIYGAKASLVDKQKAIQSYGQIQLEKVPAMLKVPFSNYIQQRIQALDHFSPATGLPAGWNNTLGGMITSTMKNNPETSILHVLQGSQRLFAMDMDSLGSNAFQGLLKAAQSMKDSPPWMGENKAGLLAKADYFVHKAAAETANLKYDNAQDRANLVSKASYQYTFGDTPGYMTMGKSMGANNPLLLSRFWVRSCIDPMSQMFNIARALNPQVVANDPQAMGKAGFAMKYLLGTTVMNTALFGAAGAMPSMMNGAFNAIVHGANWLTGNDNPDLQTTYKQLNNTLPINLIYKATGIDQTEHMMRGIPFEVGFSMLKQNFDNIKRDIPKMAEGWQQGNTAQAMAHGLSAASYLLPMMGATGLPNMTRDVNLMRGLRATGKALGGEIQWNDMPNLWLKYSSGQGRTALKDIQAQERSK